MRDSSINSFQNFSPTGNNNSKIDNTNFYLLEHLFDNLTIGLYRTTADGTILYSNEAVVKLLGFDSLEELKNRNLENEGFDGSSSRELFKKIMEEKGEVIGLESCWRRKDGSEIFVRENARVVKNENGGTIYYEGTVEDITNRKQIELALAESEERFRNLYENASVGLYRSTPDGRLMMANPALLAIYGYSSFEELSGIHARDVYFNPSDRDRFKRIIESEETVYGFESTGVKKDGSKFYFLDSARVVRDKHGKIIYYDGVVQDITEQKKAEVEIQNQNEFLNNIFESLTHPFYVVNASDYKVIMGNTISGFTSSEERPNCFVITHHQEKPCQGETDLCPLEIVKETKKPTTVEHIHFDKNNNKIIVEVHGYPIFDKDGNVIQMIEYCLDITERKKIEQELLDIQNLLSTLLNNVPVGVYRSRPDGQVLSSNPALIRMLGYDTEDEYTSIPAEKSYVNKERRAEFIEELKRNGQVKNFESQMIRKDGTIIWVSANATAAKDDGDNILYIDGSEEDVTERKRADLLRGAVYRISEASDDARSLDDLYKAVHEIIDSVLPAKNFFIALYNKEKDLLTFPYFVDEEDDPPGPIKAGRGYTAYVLRTGKSVYYTEGLDKKLKANGDVETVGTDSPSWIGVPLIVNNKTIGAMVIQHYSDPDAYDESDLHLLEYVSSQIAKAIVTKRAEEELLKLSSAVKQSSASIIITNLEGKIEYVNPKFTELTGFESEEVYGKKTNIFKSGETPLEIYNELWETIKNGGEWKGEFRNKKKNGELYWESASISPIKNAESEITHFLAVKDDITERKRIQKELIVSKEKAEEMNRLKSVFLANMSHELRTPLVGILGYAEILQGDSLNDEQKEMVGTIFSSGKRLMNTLNSILELSKLDAEKSELKLTPVILKYAIQEIAALFNPEAAKKKIELSYRIENENAVSLLDENLFREAIEHMVSNAVKYTEEGKVELILRADSDSNISILEISDTGIGISEEHQKVIFEEFRQVSEGLNRQYEGAGLGLTLTKRFIELMHGSISLESELGKGSRFTITFPLAKTLSNIEAAVDKA